MLVSTVLFVLLCEFVSMRKGRYSTAAIRPRQAVSFVSLLRHTINKCELLRTHNRHKRELLAGRMYHLAGRRARQPGTIMPDT
jgi:hypothetical protein